MAKPQGVWCIWCGEMVKQEWMGQHIWKHGIIWSHHRQGYRNGNGQDPEPLMQQPSDPPLAPVQQRLLE